MRPCVVSHLNAKATQLALGGIYFFQGKSRNIHRIGRLLIKCNWFAESPNLVQQTGLYSPSLLISCSVTAFSNRALAFAWLYSPSCRVALNRRNGDRLVQRLSNG